MGMVFRVAAFYRFSTIASPEALQGDLRGLFAADALRGTLLIAPEGVNGTLAGSPDTIDRLLDFLAAAVGLERSEVKFSTAGEQPFRRLKFLVKREIITFGQAAVDSSRAGRYVEPRDWNTLLDDGEILLLDTRNRYEVQLGTFAGAADPGIDTFSEFARYVRETLDPARHRRVAMFCTGGVRCEKASAFMLQQGFEQVFHLKGGILRYLEEVPPEQSRWNGECFVFDGRRSLRHEDFQGG